MGLKTARIIAYVVEVVGSVIAVVILLNWNGLDINKGVTVVTTDVSILAIVSQFLGMSKLSELQGDIGEGCKAIQRKVDSIASDIQVDNVYKSIHELDNEEQKAIYLKSLDVFVANMNSRINGARSGALSRLDYYAELAKAGDRISEDWRSHQDGYGGEIWAMTFWQDDELDLSDEGENAWVHKMEEIDALGVKTRRLCVMKGKKALLQRDSVDIETSGYLTRVKYYCETNAVCKNTVVYAIDNIDSLSATEQEWIGKGFFAIKLQDGELRLIRGVSLDNRNATTLGGEIDFDSERVAKIRNIWERLIVQSGSKTMNEYLASVATPAVREAMIQMGFDIK